MTLDLIDENLVLVITTESDYNNAQNLANQILKMELAKCISLNNIESIYWWEGSIESSKEVQITIKTKPELLNHLIATLKNKHTYELPQIICLSASSSKEYMEWITQPFKAL